jgi:predicted dehydrogenase
MRWLLVGHGVQGQRWKKRLGNKCVGVVDFKKLDIDVYNFFSVQDAIRSGLDFEAGLVSVSSDYHYEITHYLLSKGKHVLCEKPLCFTLSQLSSLFEVAEKNNVKFAQAMLERFNPNLLNNMQGLQKEKCMRFVRYGLKPKHRFEEGPVFDLGIHDIDLFLHYFFGKGVKFKFGYVDRLEETQRNVNGVDLKSSIDVMVSQVLLFEDSVECNNYIDGFEFLRFELGMVGLVRIQELKKKGIYTKIFEMEVDEAT